MTLLSGSAYTWHTTQYYTMGTGHANRLTWEQLKSNLQLYFKPPDDSYQKQVAFLYCKQPGDISSYIHILFWYPNKCLNVEETEAIFRFIEGLVPVVKHYVRL